MSLRCAVVNNIVDCCVPTLSVNKLPVNSVSVCRLRLGRFSRFCAAKKCHRNCCLRRSMHCKLNELKSHLFHATNSWREMLGEEVANSWFLLMFSDVHGGSRPKLRGMKARHLSWQRLKTAWIKLRGIDSTDFYKTEWIKSRREMSQPAFHAAGKIGPRTGGRGNRLNSTAGHRLCRTRPCAGRPTSHQPRDIRAGRTILIL